MWVFNRERKWRDFGVYIFIMQGQGQPFVSEFVLQAGPQIPHYLARSRLKDSHRYNYNKSGLTITNLPNEVIINVKPNNTPQHYVNPQAEGIRAEVDACLNAIQTAHSQSKQLKPQQNFIEGGDVIHRIDNNIVMDYVSTVYRDYKIRDRFGTFRPVPLKEPAIVNVTQQRPMQMQVRERASSLNRPQTRQQKQFLNVTQESRLLKPQSYLSTSKLNKTNFQFTKPDHQRTFSSQSPPYVNPNSVRLHQTTTKRSELYEKVAEDFRFCVNCEKSILSVNVDFHQKYECQDFETLYKLSFKQLSLFVDEKIKRIRSELMEKVRKLKEKNMDGITKIQVIASTMISLIEDYVKEERSQIMRFKDEVIEQQRRLTFNMFKESQNNDYSDAVELTHKLHWLQQISKKLKRQEVNNTYESIRRLELMKPIQILRLSTPPNSKNVIIEQSPVVYLHPHLHRFTKQS